MVCRSFSTVGWRAEYTSAALGFLQAGFDFTVGNGFFLDDGEKGLLVLQILKSADEFLIFFEVQDNSFLFPLFIGYILSVSFHA